MNREDVSKFFKILVSFEWRGERRLDELALEIAESDAELSMSTDEFVDRFADPNSKTYGRLAKGIKRISQNNDLFNKIKLREGYDGIYVAKLGGMASNSTFLEVTDGLDRLKDIRSSKRRGEAYEEFCIHFLQDLGIEANSTKGSNDKGIDIFGSHKIDLGSEIGNLVFNDEVYLLVQVKYFNKPIDTPVIRKLVGDSLFIRFDKLEYLKIRHNAFHLLVFSHNGFTQPAEDFAKDNKIKIFDSLNIAHVISNQPEIDWTCLKKLIV